MTYRRVDAPREFFSGKELSARLSRIGVRFAVDPVRDPNIEDVLLSAANEAIFGGDSRLWGLLFEWWHAHHPYVNAERLVRVLREVGRPKLTAFFSGLAQIGPPVRPDGLRRFTPLLKLRIARSRQHAGLLMTMP